MQYYSTLDIMKKKLNEFQQKKIMNKIENKKPSLEFFKKV